MDMGEKIYKLSTPMTNISRGQPVDVPHDRGTGRQVHRMDDHEIGSEWGVKMSMKGLR